MLLHSRKRGQDAVSQGEQSWSFPFVSQLRFEREADGRIRADWRERQS